MMRFPLQNQAERLQVGLIGHGIDQVGSKGHPGERAGAGEGGGASRTPVPSCPGASALPCLASCRGQRVEEQRDQQNSFMGEEKCQRANKENVR